MVYVGNIFIEEENYCFQIVHEQQLALQDDWNEKAMYQKLYCVAMEHGKLVEGNTKSEIQTLNAPCGKKADFDFKVGLVEELFRVI